MGAVAENENQSASVNQVESERVEEFVVGGIERRRWDKSKKTYQWLVNWDGFSHEHDTWEPEEGFISGSVVNDIWKQFEDSHPRVRGKRRMHQNAGSNKEAKL